MNGPQTEMIKASRWGVKSGFDRSSKHTIDPRDTELYYVTGGKKLRLWSCMGPRRHCVTWQCFSDTTAWLRAACAAPMPPDAWADEAK